MNKKLVILAVLLECILAVLLVSFFGKAIEDARKDVLCEDIYFVTETGEKIDDDVGIEVELSDTKLSYKLYWKIIAKNTTKKEVEFVSSKPESVIIDQTGIVTFLEETDVVITIRATDGSGKSDSITLIPVRDTESDADII